MNDEHMPPRETDDPRESDLSRRSNAPAVSIWLILFGIILLGAAVYVGSALL